MGWWRKGRWVSIRWARHLLSRLHLMLTTLWVWGSDPHFTGEELNLKVVSGLAPKLSRASTRIHTQVQQALRTMLVSPYPGLS